MRGHRNTRIGVVFFIFSTLSAASACGLSGPVDTGEEGNEATGASDGSTSTGGSDGAGNAPNGPSTTTGGGEQEEPSCDNIPEGLDPELLDLCPADICAGGARCVPTVLVEAQGSADQAEQLANCDADAKCVPDTFIATQGFFTPETCSSLLGAEGRCLSICIPEVAEQDDRVGLPVDVCGEFEVCAPCYDPQTGESTGACEQSCDEGPIEEPVLLPACCGGLGKCVPSSAVPDAQRENLGDYGCAEATQGDFICAPNVFVEDLNYAPAPCDDIPFLAKLALPSWAEEGRCLPDCLPGIDDAQVELQQGACQNDFKCVPCYEPGGLFGPPEPTGACDY